MTKQAKLDTVRLTDWIAVFIVIPLIPLLVCYVVRSYFELSLTWRQLWCSELPMLALQLLFMVFFRCHDLLQSRTSGRLFFNICRYVAGVIVIIVAMTFVFYGLDAYQTDSKLYHRATDGQQWGLIKMWIYCIGGGGGAYGIIELVEFFTNKKVEEIIDARK